MAPTQRRGRKAPAKKAAPKRNLKKDTNAAVAKRKAAAVAKREADMKAKHVALERELAPIAKEINHRFNEAAKLDTKAHDIEGKADDHRLAAALRIAEAEKRCKAEKHNFKQWAEANIKQQSYETVRKLLQVGRADEPALALADMREKNRRRNVEHRARAKAGKAVSRDTGPRGKQERKLTGIEIAEKALQGLGDKGEVSLIESRATKHGMVVVPKAEGAKLRALDEGYGKPDVAKAAFNALKPSDKMSFLAWAANEVGATLDTTALTTPPSGKAKAKGNGSAADIIGEMPEHLRRGKGGAKKAPARGRKRASA